MSEFGCKAENICSVRVFRVLNLLGHGALVSFRFVAHRQTRKNTTHIATLNRSVLGRPGLLAALHSSLPPFVWLTV
jgi:hypothetical protein